METDVQITIDVPDDKVFYLCEHGSFESEHIPYIVSLGLEFVETEYEGVPKYLGITPDLKASYYIGADWLTAKKAVVVIPKMQDIDYISMFMSALKKSQSASYFSKFYGIEFSKPKIESKALDCILTPLIVIHFLTAVCRLLEKGLKKGYIIREENLQAKIKGKVMMSQQYAKNIVNGRKGRMMCVYQEYSEDIPENRLIKKALLYIKRVISNMQSLQMHKMSFEINKMFNKSFAAFIHVSDDIDVSSVRSIQKNKLYGDYGEAIRLAKLVLKRYDYSIDNIQSDCKLVPPFWIDMSRLYEVYVYNLLDEAYPHQIKFQVEGNYRTAVDFLKMDEKLIMDAKYKPYYGSSNSRIIDDIREISGYARDEKILEELGVNQDDSVPNCLIIYPQIEDGDMIKLNGGNSILLEAKCIDGFKRFYKVCIPVPKVTR